MNPLFNMMQNQSLNGLDELKTIFRSSNNPIALFSQIAQNRPELQPLVQMMNKGISPEQIVKNECSKRGIDYHQFMSNLRK